MSHAAPAASRDELIRDHLPLVRRVAYNLARRLPPNVDVHDLVGAGTEGLLKAADHFDPAVCIEFEPYAYTRVRGAMLDELRLYDHVTRYGRQRAAEIADAIADLQHAHRRAPTEDEIADHLGIELERFHRWTGELAAGLSLRGVCSVHPDIAPSSLPRPDDEALDNDLKRRLAAALRLLPVRMQQVLALYYQEECTQLEIADIIGVTESRVCQILGEAAMRLRGMLEDGWRGRRAASKHGWRGRYNYRAVTRSVTTVCSSAA